MCPLSLSVSAFWETCLISVGSLPKAFNSSTYTWKAWLTRDMASPTSWIDCLIALFMMQRRHPFFATHFSSVTTATLYMRRPFLHSRSRDHQLDVILFRPFGPEFIGLLHGSQILGEQQFLLRELLRDRLIEGRRTAGRHVFLPEPIL